MKGDYFIKIKVFSVEIGDVIDVSFYFFFDVLKVILSIGMNNFFEVYCEGSYSVFVNDNVLMLKYIGEGICILDEDESIFLIKKEDN